MRKLIAFTGATWQNVLMQNHLGELRVEAKRENLRTISYFIQGIGERLQLRDETLFEVEVSVEEACTNIITHAYDGDSNHEIHLSAELIGNTLRITLTDWGKPFDMSKVKPFDRHAPIEDRAKGGMGLHFINSLMDGSERIIPRNPGDPNQLTLIKKVEQAKVKRPTKRETRELDAMRMVSEGIVSGIQLDELLSLIINKLVETIGADRGTLYLVDDTRGELWSKVLLEDQRVLPEIRIKIGEGLAGHVAATGRGINLRNAYAEPRFNPIFDRMTGYLTQTMLAVPMRNPQQKIIGVVQLINKKAGQFTARDERLLTAMAAQAAISIENARLYSQELEQQVLKRELQTARNIQQSFLPEKVPTIPGWDIEAFWQPVQSVAGDFYDFMPFDDGRLAITIADVSGKGIPAALFMSLCVTVLRFGISLNLPPAEVIGSANRVIISNQRSRMFATVFLGYLDPESGEMLYASAGHNPPIFYCDATTECRDITASGVAVGVFQGAGFGEEKIKFDPGDVLVLYTDGITEILDENEDEFGEDRLREVIRANYHRAASAIKHEIIRAVEAFAGEQGIIDDQTLVIIKRS